MRTLVTARRCTLIGNIAEVNEVHHLHAWALTLERPLVTLHATVNEGSDTHAVVQHIKAVLKSEFGINHSTVQVEQGPCPDDVPH